MAKQGTMRVISSRTVTAVIRHIVLSPTEGMAPGWRAGAHVRVALPFGGDRPYSLMPLQQSEVSGPSLGVLLEPEGAGGSRYMHSLAPGDVVTVSEPANNFPLHDGDAPAMLFAGGIGVTPILSMAAELAERGTPFRVHYAGRLPESLAFVDELRGICADALSVHHDCDDTRLDITAALQAANRTSHIYACGPAGMIDAINAAALAQGFPSDRIHFELFKAAAADAGDGSFEVVIASTGQVITVPPDLSIVEAMQDAGLDPLYDCKRGDCGICRTGVLAGVPDHRDVVLSPAERASNKFIHICVSRAKTPRLVLDL